MEGTRILITGASGQIGRGLLHVLARHNEVHSFSQLLDEMHVGPAAGFDERSHRAVQFTRRKKSGKVAVGAS